MGVKSGVVEAMQYSIVYIYMYAYLQTLSRPLLYICSQTYTDINSSLPMWMAVILIRPAVSPIGPAVFQNDQQEMELLQNVTAGFLDPQKTTGFHPLATSLLELLTLHMIFYFIICLLNSIILLLKIFGFCPYSSLNLNIIQKNLV